MTISVLPPVGRKVAWEHAGPLPEFDGYQSLWLDSGTSALATAMLLAKKAKPDLVKPEVVLPAYGCPDLVAAAVYAGVKPVLVDITSDDPGYDLAALANAITNNTLAVVAVCFLGIRERLGEIKKVIGDDIVLIEDNAQWFPELSSDDGLMGDLAINSFGRGKPASVLGGGLLLASAESLGLGHVASLDDFRNQLTEAPQARIQALVKIALYNVLRNPLLYGLVSQLPFLKLGQTEFHELNDTFLMSPVTRSLVAANVEHYCKSDRHLEEQYDRLFDGLEYVQPIASTDNKRRKRLLRFPLVSASAHLRNRQLKALNGMGLGASAMYQQSLCTIDTVSSLVEVRGSIRGANQFAERLIALPLHEYVSPKHLQQVMNCFARA